MWTGCCKCYTTVGTVLILVFFFIQSQIGPENDFSFIVMGANDVRTFLYMVLYMIFTSNRNILVLVDLHKTEKLFSINGETLLQIISLKFKNFWRDGKEKLVDSLRGLYIIISIRHE